MRIKIPGLPVLTFLSVLSACADPCLTDPKGFEACVADREVRFAAMQQSDDDEKSSALAVEPPTAKDAADRIANSGMKQDDERLEIKTVTVNPGIKPDGASNILDNDGVKDGGAGEQPDGKTLDDAQEVTAEAVTEEKREEAIEKAVQSKDEDDSPRTNDGKEGVDIF